MSAVAPSAVAFYDRIASTYDQMLEGDARVRTAFQRLVLANVAPGSTVLDYGCGTGTDALFYSQNGLPVLAWDPSAGMLALLKQKCAQPIAQGLVRVLDSGKPPLEMELPTAVVSNFAVLSLVPDLGALFQDWADWLPAGGKLILSAQNPYYWRDFRRRWWLRGAAQLARHGTLTISSGPAQLHRRSARAIDTAARPYFSRNRDAKSLSAQTFAKFRFLVYTRCP